eukprot:Gb_41319 [translate_table: standard]
MALLKAFAIASLQCSMPS